MNYDFREKGYSAKYILSCSGSNHRFRCNEFQVILKPNIDRGSSYMFGVKLYTDIFDITTDETYMKMEVWQYKLTGGGMKVAFFFINHFLLIINKILA